MIRTLAITLLLGLATSSTPNVLADEHNPCTDIDQHLSDGAYSDAIQGINQCLSDGEHASESYGCLLLKRGRAYFEMGQSDKSGGDVGSAVRKNPALAAPEKAAACLSVSEKEAASLLATKTNH